MSRPFPAKFESDCPKCGEKIQVGMMAIFESKTSKDPIHENCPKGVGIAGAAIPPKPIFIQLAVWVHIEDAPRLLDFIKTVKIKETE